MKTALGVLALALAACTPFREQPEATDARADVRDVLDVRDAADVVDVTSVPDAPAVLDAPDAADTRDPDGPWGGPRLSGDGATRDFVVGGRCGVPSDARAVVLNVTVVDATAGGNLRLFAQGIAAPLASVINFRAGQVRANNAVVRLSGSPGALTVQTDVQAGSTHAVVDVNGYFR